MSSKRIYRLSTYCDEKLKARVERAAESYGLSVSAYLHLLIHSAMNKRATDNFIRFVTADDGDPYIKILSEE